MTDDPESAEFHDFFDEVPDVEYFDQASSHALAQLEKDLQYEKDRRREERFLFVAIITVLTDGVIFLRMETWAGPMVIGFIELCGLALYARHCGVEEVERIMDRFLMFAPWGNGKNKQQAE